MSAENKFLVSRLCPGMLSPRQSQVNLHVTIYNDDIYNHLLVFTLALNQICISGPANGHKKWIY
jgi:hypothetical protein